MIRAHFRFGVCTHPGRRHDNADAWAATTRRVVVCDGAGPFGQWSALEAAQAAMHTMPGDLAGAVLAADSAVRAVHTEAISTIVAIELGEIAPAEAVTVTTPADTPVSVNPDMCTSAKRRPAKPSSSVAVVAPVTAAAPVAGVMSVAHVGDSLCAFVAGDRGASWVTAAHNGAAGLVRSGVIGPGEAAGHPFRHQLTRCLGSFAAAPELTEIAVRSGDRAVLMTDGVHAVLDLATVAALARIDDLDAAAVALVDAAFASGATDNMTAVVVEIVTAQHEPGGGRRWHRAR